MNRAKHKRNTTCMCINPMTSSVVTITMCASAIKLLSLDVDFLFLQVRKVNKRVLIDKKVMTLRVMEGNRADELI